MNCFKYLGILIGSGMEHFLHYKSMMHWTYATWEANAKTVWWVFFIFFGLILKFEMVCFGLLVYSSYEALTWLVVCVWRCYFAFWEMGETVNAEVAAWDVAAMAIHGSVCIHDCLILWAWFMWSSQAASSTSLCAK